jgi:hypothetical protein
MGVVAHDEVLHLAYRSTAMGQIIDVSKIKRMTGVD